MKPCRDLPYYLRQKLNDAGRASFEDHLADCPACRDDLEIWNHYEGDLEGWVESRTQSAPTDENVRQFMERLPREERRAPVWGRPAVWLTAAGAAAAVFVAYFSFTSTVQAPAVAPPSPVAVAPREPEAPALPRIIESTSSETHLATLEDDTLGLDRNSRLAVLESSRTATRLKLERGTVALDVAPLSADATFELQVASHTVRVAGTRFSVRLIESGGFDLAVTSGVVEVLDENSELSAQVEAGSRFAWRTAQESARAPLLEREVEQINTLLGLPAAAQPSDAKEELPEVKRAARPAPELQPLGAYREMIVTGDLKTARAGLRRYVDVHPADENAWMLLADCERKLANWPRSVRAYKKVIRGKDPRRAAKARYMAAEVLSRRMNKHKEAAALYAAYLSSGQVSPALRDSAKVSYGRTLIALGETKKARRILTEVLESPRESFVSKNARRLLDSIDAD